MMKIEFGIIRSVRVINMESNSMTMNIPHNLSSLLEAICLLQKASQRQAKNGDFVARLNLVFIQ